MLEDIVKKRLVLVKRFNAMISTLSSMGRVHRKRGFIYPFSWSVHDDCVIVGFVLECSI